MKSCCRTILIALIVAILAAPLQPVRAVGLAQTKPDSAEITPANINQTLLAGQGFTQEIRVKTAKTPIPKLDVLFVFDVTSSMRNVIAEAKTNGTKIMNEVRSKVADTAFGVASFSDYPKSYNYAGYSAQYGQSSDYPWKLHQSITTDIAGAQAAINSLALMNGGDGPEDYSRALYETMLVNWRAGAKRVVILFGDAPAHDTTFNAKNYGVDPGPDAVAGNADDLVFTDIVSRVASYPITIFPINSNQTNDATVQKEYELIASQTRGRMFTLKNASEASAAVTAGLLEASTIIRRLGLEASKEKPDWVELRTRPFENVEGGQTRSFEVVIDVPPVVKPGTYQFTLTVTADGAVLGTIPVSITVGYKALNAAELIAKKQDLIKFLSSPNGTIEIFSVGVPFLAAKNYTDTEKNATTWINSIQPASAQPAQLGSLGRLVAQEDGVKQLWLAHIDSGGIVAKNISHIVVIGFSFIKLLDFLTRPDIANKLKGLATKVVNEVSKKIYDAIMDALKFLAGQIPDKGDSKKMQAIIEGVHLVGKTILEENPSKNIGDLITRGVLPYAILELMNTDFVEATQDDLQSGIDRAKRLSEVSIDMNTASSGVGQAENRVNLAVSSAVGSLEQVKKDATTAEKVQDVVGIVTDAADVAATIAALSPAAVFAAITKGLTLVIRLIDAVISAWMIGRAGAIWSELGPAAEKVTRESFPDTTAEWIDPSQKPVVARSPLFAVESRVVGDAPSEVKLAAPLMARLADSRDDLKAALSRLSGAARGGNVDGVVAATNEILGLDPNFAAQLRASQAVALNASTNPTLNASREWQQAYSGLGSASTRYSLASAIVYIQILGVVYDPQNEQARAALLSGIEDETGAIDAAVSAASRTLPLAERYITRPVVSISDVRYPESIRQGQEFNLTVRLANPVSRAANQLEATLTGQDGLEVSAARVSLAALNPGDEVEIVFKARLTKAEGYGLVEVTGPNVSGDNRPVRVAATVKTNSALLPAILLLVFGVLLIGLAVLMLARSSQRGSRRGPPARPGMPIRR